ncbi:MAG: hypothetical protein M0R77_00100 [Gammaproteobacteria bacterium]|nr:hypothetical protein [Acholeplasmataceae bacterium]MCK9528955.1 hypothetical protein [Gammaproteobacteria bacterium]
MAKSKKPRKKHNPNKTTFNRPPLFRYSKEEGEMLKERIYFHLSRFEDRVANAGDYIAIRFRIEVGINLADHFENNEFKLLFHAALDTLTKVLTRRETSGKWAMGDNEIAELKYAISIVDEIQDKTTRVEQLPAFLKANENVDNSLFERLP